LTFSLTAAPIFSILVEENAKGIRGKGNRWKDYIYTSGPGRKSGLFKRDSVIIVPFGSTEQHGLHLPSETTRWCKSLAEDAARLTKTIVALLLVRWSPHTSRTIANVHANLYKVSAGPARITRPPRWRPGKGAEDLHRESIAFVQNLQKSAQTPGEKKLYDAT